MTPSLSPHGTLTERVVKNMSGKGREGKGIRKGRENSTIETSIISSGSVTRTGATP